MRLPVTLTRAIDLLRHGIIESSAALDRAQIQWMRAGFAPLLRRRVDESLSPLPIKQQPAPSGKAVCTWPAWPGLRPGRRVPVAGAARPGSPGNTRSIRAAAHMQKRRLGVGVPAGRPHPVNVFANGNLLIDQ